MSKVFIKPPPLIALFGKPSFDIFCRFLIKKLYILPVCTPLESLDWLDKYKFSPSKPIAASGVSP